MPAVNLSPFGPKPQFLLATGLPAVGYKLFFYVAGSVGTKLNTYTDSTGGVANTNPVVLNSLGEPTTQIWFQAGLLYKAVLAPSTDTDPPTSAIWTVDNIAGINDTSLNTPSEWVASGFTPTFISTTSFSVPGDQTSTLMVGRRIKATTSGGTRYGWISSSAFGAGITTVGVTLDSGVLDAGLSAVSYSILSATNIGLPVAIVQFDTVKAASGSTKGYALATNAGTTFPTRLHNDANDASVLKPGKAGGEILFNSFADANNARITDAGLFLLNIATGTLHRIKLNVAEGLNILELIGGVTTGHFFSSVATQGWNVALAAMAVGSHSGTGRSINAGGTINASGADYAEYERKAADCGTVVPGQIVGFDVNGRVTDKWSQCAGTYGVKSTNPTIVGGDTWGTPEALGMAQPEIPDNEALMPAYEQAMTEFRARLEAARQTVDRIAYCGKCPVNVTANPGDYIIAEQGPNDSIVASVVTADAITFEQYRHAVGRVRRTLDAGRVEIVVKAA